MNNRPLFLLVMLALGMTLVSCQSTLPTAADMDRYHQKAEQMAQQQIALLDAQRSHGAITREMYDANVTAIKAGIPKKAAELAWAKHELSESQKRALGIPTGDFSQQVNVPRSGGQDSFYRPYGQALDNNTSPSNQQSRGYTPGFGADSIGPR